MNTFPAGPGSSVIRNLMAGTATNYAVLGVNLALGLVLMPFTVRHLGTSQYGLWMLVASLTSYFQLLDLGTAPGSSGTWRMPMRAGTCPASTGS